MKNISKLEIGYYLPMVTIAEIAAIPITIGVSALINEFRLSDLLNNIAQVLAIATVLIAVALAAMLVVTIQYQHSNTFANYCSSVVQTYNLRKFSKIQPKTTQVKTGKDPAERAFNQAIQGWYIDRQKNSLTIWLFLPNESSAINKLDRELPTILMKIKQNNPEYIFSPHERVGNYYKIEATRY